MLPILVLIVTSCTLASAGVVQIKTVSSNDPSSTNRDRTVVDHVLSSFDAGFATPNLLNVGAILRDLSKLEGDQSLTHGQLVAFFGEVSNGRSGDACAAANYIDAYTKYVASGNPSGLREALKGYVQDLNRKVEDLFKHVIDRKSSKYVTGARGGCSDEGRNYQFDAAWDIIVGSAAPDRQRLIIEESCVAKRLSYAVNARNNNIGAHLTATALPPTAQIFELSRKQLAEFLRSLIGQGNPASSGAALQQAFSSAVNKVSI